MVFTVNLWVFYLGSYLYVYPLKMWAEKKRGTPFEDPELASKKNVLIPAMIWIFAGLIISIFTPISTGFLFYIGIIISTIGLVLVTLAFYSFSQNPGLNVNKIHKYTRNPNYIGWDIFIGGLCFIGWTNSVWSIIFLFYFIYTIFYLHYTIKIEEKFLLNKYGDSYREYLEKTPRYFRF